jgi:Asp-tRNA(Asn)/Glu-tRNA(Gln) amidotransferase A subunit family amidase
VDVYQAQSKLREAAAQCRTLLLEASGTSAEELQSSGIPSMPFLVVPTVMHHYTAAELLAQEGQGEVSYNSHLGTFTNFVNLLGMCAVSVPFSKFECPAPEVC